MLVPQYNHVLYTNKDVINCNSNEQKQIVDWTYDNSKPSYHLGDFPSIIKQHKCSKPSIGDGIWDETNHRHIQRIHINSTCPRHWRCYWKRYYHNNKQKLDGYKNYASVRFTIKKILTTKQYTDLIKRLTATSIDGSAKRQKIVCVLPHSRDKKGMHLHILFGSNKKIDLKLFGELWKQANPNKPLQFDYHWFSAKHHKHPHRWLWYCIFGSKRKPRVLPSWRLFQYKSPVRFSNVHQRKV